MAGYHQFAQYYDLLTGNVDYQKRCAYFIQLFEKHKNSKLQGDLLLDLACGTGSLTFAFEKQGYNCIGVDASEEMLSVAMEKKLALSSNALFLCQDLAGLDLYGTVDYAVCALDSLNHITDEHKLQKVFQKISLFLHPQGLFVFDVNTPYKHARILGEQAFVYDLPEVYCVWQNHYRPKHHMVDICLDFFYPQGESYVRESERFCERAYTGEELQNMLQHAGLEVVAIYKGDTLYSIDETTQRAVYVVKKET